MAHPLRIDIPVAWYHVMNRGVSRQAIVTADEQRHHFLTLLADTVERFSADWRACFLMGNHTRGGTRRCIFVGTRVI